MKSKRQGTKPTIILAGLGAALLLSAGPALADGGRHYYRAPGHHDCHGERYRDHHRHDYRHHRKSKRYHHRHHHSDYRVGYVVPATPVYRAYQPVRPATTVYHARGAYAQTPNFGNAVGGALGGFVGSKIGSGSGQLAATAAGAVIGYAIGGNIGSGY